MHLLVKVENVSRYGCIGNGGSTKAEDQSEMHDRRDLGTLKGQSAQRDKRRKSRAY